MGGTRNAVKHLIKSTGSPVHFLGGPQSDHSFSERLIGYKCACGEMNQPVDDEYVHLTPNPGMTGGYETARSTFAKRLPRAVFCANDELAIGLLRWLNEQNIRVPEQVAVVGFDDIPMAAHVYPTLTSVHVHKEYMGTVGVRKLIELIHGDKSSPLVNIISTNLICRDSSPE
jgi:LacI family transcriptional regulator